MRQVSRYLEEFFKFLCLHLVNQQSHDNRERECYRDGIKTDDDCVFDGQTELTQMNYEFYPEALEHVLRRVAEDFHCDLYVTEDRKSVV